MGTEVTEPHHDLDETIARQKRLEARNLRQRILNIALVVITAIAVSGWLTSSLDHRAQHRNGQVADCRSAAQAKLLDAFKVLVSPDATHGQKDTATRKIDRLPTLEVAYHQCSTIPGGTP